MTLPEPPLDNRTYRELLRETLRRIPVHNPEWTNFNDSDPGMTLLQLFAFMAENLLYRANQVPARNRLKFLSLLGIQMRPAAAARGFVVIRNERGPFEVISRDVGLDVRSGPVRFETTTGLEVLPVEAKVFYKRRLPEPAADDEAAKEQEDLYRRLYADLLTTSEPAFYDTVPLPAVTSEGALPVVDVINDTVDRSLWLALLGRKDDPLDQARAKIAGRILTVGVMPVLSAEGLRIPAGSERVEQIAQRVVWEAADASGRQAKYVPLSVRSFADVLNEPGLVELTLPPTVATWEAFEPGEEGTGDFPPALADTNFGGRVLTWIRLRIPEASTAEANGTAKALISWLDINAAWIVQQARVQGEIIGTGNGEPDQCLNLVNTPVIPGTLRLTVAGQEWTEIDDLLAAAPEVPVEDPRRPIYQHEPHGATACDPVVNAFTLDPATGRVCFGDGAHGARPRPGERIVASYAFGGGRQGNLGVGAINRSPSLEAGLKVDNPLRTWGGDDAESPESAEKTIPRVVQHRDRLVSVQDFRDITWRTPGVDLGRVEILPLYDPVSDLESVPGVVTVMVAPLYDPLSPAAPQPDRFFLDTVCSYLQPRRLVTTELHVRGPVYRDIAVSVGVEIAGGRAAAPVLEAVKNELKTFLSPLTGGREQTGWPLDTPVLQRELEAVVARVDGVRLVRELRLGLVDKGAVGQTDSVGIELLQLPRLMAVEAAVDRPVPLDQLLRAPQAAGAEFTPVPVVPPGC